MTKAICEDCGSLVDAEITHNGVCEVGHYVHCGWGHMLSPSDLISDTAANRIEELEAKAMKASNAALLEKRRADAAEARVKELDAEIAKWRAAFIAQTKKLQEENK